MDNGIGIPADFDWRNTALPVLHLVVTHIDRVKGAIELVREGGTLFVIRIPVAHEVR
jgi:two-component sensor histidine kinase